MDLHRDSNVELLELALRILKSESRKIAIVGRTPREVFDNIFPRLYSLFETLNYHVERNRNNGFLVDGELEIYGFVYDSEKMRWEGPGELKIYGFSENVFPLKTLLR